MRFNSMSSVNGIGTRMRTNAKIFMLKGAQKGLRFIQGHPRLTEKAQNVLDTITPMPALGPELVPVEGGQLGHDVNAAVDRLSNKVSLHLMQSLGNESTREWGITDQHENVRETVRKFCDTDENKKFFKTLHKTDRFPRGLFEVMTESMGLLGAIIPEQYGGSDMDARAISIIMEELAYFSPAVALSYDIAGGLIPHILMEHGSKEQKEKYLTAIARGDTIASFGLTDTSSGTDLSSMKTSAVRNGNEFVINGSKRFITNATEADLIVLFAKARGEEKSESSFSAFLVEPKVLQGLSVHQMNDKMGCKGSGTAELFFDDVRIPAESLIGNIGDGRTIALDSLNLARIEISAFVLGMARRALDIAADYVQNKKSFGAPLATKQAIQKDFGEMRVKLEMAKQMIYRAAWLADQGKDYRYVAAEAKVAAVSLASEIVDMAQRKLGGDGYMDEYEISRIVGDLRVAFPGEGDNDILQIVLGAETLGVRKSL